jgi:hypothetical protein
MKAPSSSKYDYTPNDADWHLTIAWLPVKIQGEWYWLCDVMRRRVFVTDGFFTSRWEYKFPTIADQQRYIDEHKDV